MIKILFLFLFIFACTFFNSNEKIQGHYQLYSRPEKLGYDFDKDQSQLISFVYTNDIQGDYGPHEVEVVSKDRKNNFLMSFGGKNIFKQYLNILKKEVPSRPILIDGGNWSGNFLSAKAFDYFKDNNYDFLALGRKEWENISTLSSYATIDPGFKRFIKKSSLPFVQTNLIELSKVAPPDWDNLLQKQVIQKDNLKIGILSYTSKETMSNLSPNVLRGFYFGDTLASLIKEARKMRNDGVDIIGIILGDGFSCGKLRAKQKSLPIEKVNFKNKEAACDQTHPTFKLIKGLPQDLIDIVFLSGGETKVANFISTTPVVANPVKFQSFIQVDLYWNKEKKKLIQEKTTIHQPVRLCHYFFKETQDCFHRDRSIDHRETTQAKFMGYLIDTKALHSDTL